VVTFTRSHLFEHELKTLLEEEIERLKEALSHGAVTTIEEYKLSVGKIAGLRTALDYMDEANSICNRKM